MSAVAARPTADERASTSADTAAGMSVLALVREDWIANNRSWLKPGFHAVAVYRLGAWRHRLPAPARQAVGIVAKALHVFVRNVYGIELSDATTVGRRLIISHGGGIVIHHRSVIGDDCRIRQNCTIGGTNNHRWPDAPMIGDRVELGAGAVIAGNVRIGNDVRIGPNAVVMSNVPDGATVFATPARIMQPPAPRTRQGGEEVA